MALEFVKNGYSVLLVWGSNTPPDNLTELVNKIKEKTGSNGKVQVENDTMLSSSGHHQSTFDIALSGLSQHFQHTENLLNEVLRILKPNGCLILKQTLDRNTFEDVKSSLILSGYTDIEKVHSDEKSVEIKCQKPNFEVGKVSKLPLSFAKKKNKSETKKVWTLSATDMNDDEVGIIDSDSLLDASDLIKPDLSNVKTDCGSNKNGKRKACKGCTCGLAEELDNGNTEAQPKSACGSCYLGDAFRCASCPYLGMPPFKPGEQITLSDRQLKPDI